MLALEQQIPLHIRISSRSGFSMFVLKINDSLPKPLFSNGSGKYACPVCINLTKL